MIEISCPQCEVILEVHEDMAGHAVPCPQCGTVVTVPVTASSQVIEVHAEAVGEEEDEPRYEEDPFFNPDAQRPHGPDQIFGRSVHVQRVGDGGGGCCLAGCAIVALAAFFMLYGIVSFFTG